jgi:hypothetical protein
MTTHAKDFATFTEALASLGSIGTDLGARFAGPAAREMLSDLAAAQRKASEIATAVTDCRDSRFTVAVVGEMNAGKSTLLNGLVTGREVFPSDPNPCSAKLLRVVRAQAAAETAVVDFLTATDWQSLQEAAQRARAAKANKEVAERRDLDAKEIVEFGEQTLGAELPSWLGHAPIPVPIAALKDYVTAQGKYTPVVAGALVQTAHDFDARLEFLDTPGLFDPVRSREAVTMEQVGKASAVVLVLSAGAPLGRDSALFLREKLLTAGLDKILIVINRVDELDAADRPRVVAHVRKRLADLAVQWASQLPAELMAALTSSQALAVSGLMGLYARTRGGIADAEFYEGQWRDSYSFSTYPEAWEASGLPLLRKEVEALVVGKDGIERLQVPLRKVVAAVYELQRQLDVKGTEIAQAKAAVSQELNELRAERDRLNRINAKAKSSIAKMRDPLVGMVENRIGRAKKSATAAVDEVELKLSTYALGLTEENVEAVNVRLAYIARGVESKIPSLIGEAAEDLGADLANNFKDSVEREMKDLNLADDPYLGGALRWVGNYELPEFNRDADIAVADTRTGWNSFVDWFGKPKNLWTQARIAVIAALPQWTRAQNRRVTAYANTVSKDILAKYVDVALRDLSDRVDAQLRALTAEIESRSAAGDPEVRRAEIVRQDSVCQAELAFAAELRNRLDDCRHRAGL